MKKYLSLLLAAAIVMTLGVADAQTRNSSFGDEEANADTSVSSSVGTPAGGLTPAKVAPSIPGLTASSGIGGTADQILKTPSAPVPPTVPGIPGVPATQPAQAGTDSANAAAPPQQTDACAAFMASSDLYLSCQDRMKKIQRMQEARDARIPPVAAAPATTAPAEATTNDPAAVAAAAAAAAVAAGQEKKITRKKGIITNKDKK